eukprot:3197745-Alexandrium_andersonii.AAC.1
MVLVHLVLMLLLGVLVHLVGQYPLELVQGRAEVRRELGRPCPDLRLQARKSSVACWSSVSGK